VPVAAAGHEPSLGWHGNALLVAPGVTAEEVHGLRLPGLEPRGALIADLRLSGGAPLRVVAVHLGLLRASRQKQLAAIRADLDRRAPRPTIILGDFNEWHPERGLDPFDDWEFHAPGPTFHAARPVAALDRLITTPDLAVDTAEVVSTALSRVASDHLPLTARLRLRGP
jgi:endonuclease/exonuclease/phosphatase family metal-dependent hydrolase